MLEGPWRLTISLLCRSNVAFTKREPRAKPRASSVFEMQVCHLGVQDWKGKEQVPYRDGSALQSEGPSLSGASPSQLRISEPWVWGAIYPSDSREDEEQYCKACQPQQWNLRRHIYAGHSVLSTLLLLVSQRPTGVQMFPTQPYISVLYPVSPTCKKRGSHQLPPSPYLHILSPDSNSAS